MGRRRSSYDRVGLPAGAAEALRINVRTLVGRLLELAPPFPLTRRQVEERFAPPEKLDMLRAVMSFAPNHASPELSVGLTVRDRTGSGRDFKWRLQVHNHDCSWQKREDGFLVPEKIKGYAPPDRDEVNAKLTAWARARFALGLEAGSAVQYVGDFLAICRSPLQVKKLWPELLDYAGEDDDVAKLKSKHSANEATRARVPEEWDQNTYWAQGRETTRMTLAKCALLAAAPKARTGLGVTSFGVDGLDLPRAKWSGKPFMAL